MNIAIKDLDSEKSLDKTTMTTVLGGSTPIPQPPPGRLVRESVRRYRTLIGSFGLKIYR